MRPKYDILWKGMIEEVMEDLLLFVEPGIGDDLDLKRGFEFLDKELAEMYPNPERPSSTRVVDKLVRVYLCDGSERWMLLHVEVQGTNDRDFPKRMFQYYCRLMDKYGQPVAAIAVFTGPDGNKMPGAYEDRCLWMRSVYEYKTLSITDYPDDLLSASTNPFAVVVMVAKETLLRVKGSDEDLDMVLLEQKLKIVKLLTEKMGLFGERKTSAIFNFLNNYVVFKKPETNRIFMEQTDQITGKTNTMGIIEQWAEIRHQEGIQEGIGKGKEESVRLFLFNTDFSVKKIAEMVGVSIAFVKKVKETTQVN